MKLNPEMVVLAREYRGYTQEQLAFRSKFSQPKIARLESGVSSELTPDELKKLAEALQFPNDFFMQDEARIGFGSSSYFYRKKASLSASDRKRIHAVVNILRIHIKRMLSAVDVEAARGIRKLELEEYGGKPALVARAIRDFWKLPDGPLKNLTAAIESAGIIVAPCDFGTREMDGTSLWIGELPPIIFIRSDLPGDRWRFTLAHELGHIVMHEVPTETMEDEADQFAAELLMPERDIKPDLARYRKLALGHLADLKMVWRVAMQSLLRRSRDLGYTSENQARYLYQQMSALGYRTQEPVHVERETPKTLSGLLNCFTEQMGFSGDELSSFLRAPRDDVERLYQIKFRPRAIEKPKLRLVT
jgi:Zn-dependent peptidase ImmA (M78 family)/transcriptional regulator with XRE-family HTH domain